MSTEGFQGFIQFIKFSLVGGVGAIIDFTVLYLLVQFLGVWYILAATISFVLAVINNFFWNKYWTFRDSRGGIARQFSQFLIVSTVGLGLNNGMLFALVEGSGLFYMWAKVFATALVLAWNFTANKFWTFRSERTEGIRRAGDQGIRRSGDQGIRRSEDQGIRKREDSCASSNLRHHG